MSTETPTQPAEPRINYKIVDDRIVYDTPRVPGQPQVPAAPALPDADRVWELVRNWAEYGRTGGSTTATANLDRALRVRDAEVGQLREELARWEASTGGQPLDAMAARLEDLVSRLARWERASGMTLEQCEATAPGGAKAP